MRADALVSGTINRLWGLGIGGTGIEALGGTEMARLSIPSDLRRGLALALGGACLALATPAAVFALGGGSSEGTGYNALPAFAQFTPAGIDPALARRAEAIAQAKGLSFTPAGTPGRQGKPMTVAVRVDDDVARAVNVRRSAIASAHGASGRTAAPVAITPTHYDLGTARGYQSFAQPVAAPARLAVGTRKLDLEDVPMADLSLYGRKLAEPAGKPSRFSSRVVLETDEGAPGRTPRTLEALGEQSVDVSGSYRVLRNLNVTAGVRLSQDRDRLAPLTDAEQDAKSVYVGTQFKF